METPLFDSEESRLEQKLGRILDALCVVIILLGLMATKLLFFSPQLVRP